QKVKKLNDTLESRKIVEKAKWILVEQNGLSEAEAYEAIKKKSRDNRMPMKSIAEALILTRGMS
ncbi:MAG: ANTAR domain-containing response regulator, partial [Bacillota bacterium]